MRSKCCDNVGLVSPVMQQILIVKTQLLSAIARIDTSKRRSQYVLLRVMRGLGNVQICRAVVLFLHQWIYVGYVYPAELSGCESLSAYLGL